MIFQFAYYNEKQKFPNVYVNAQVTELLYQTCKLGMGAYVSNSIS